ncbi:hypothetical protein BHM03_00041296 [Ensete ventricosum]|nr:hypothetical protein BHM03_00041296 [Ensete ventricosum]
MLFFCSLWDLGQQRCVHSYAVHTDSVWALASNSTFTHVYSGGRDLSVNSSVHRLPAEGCNPQKVFERGGSFLAGNLSFTRARASLEGSAPVPVYKEPSFTIPGIPGIVQYEILNNRRHVLTKVIISTCSLQDTSGSVKLWEITRGVVIEDYGKVLFYTSWKCLFSGTRGLEEYLSCFILCRCSFHLQACEGSSVQILTQGKLSAPRILRINKVSICFKH